jgi:hypothetical protein
MIDILRMLLIIGAAGAVGCSCPAAEQESQAVPALGCTNASPCIGEATLYDTATLASAPSACNMVNDGLLENVVALSVQLFSGADHDPCGQNITIRYKEKMARGKVVDKCTGCDRTSIDLSRRLFSMLDTLDTGLLKDVEWWFDDSS